MKPGEHLNHKFMTGIALMACAVLVVSIVLIAGVASFFEVRAQNSYPSPPADRALVYYADESGRLAALPFEAGSSPLSTDEVARSNRHSYVELRGEHAQTVMKTDEPRLYLFVVDAANVHPPFLVRLEERRGSRRVTAIAQKGSRGFAIDSEEIIKPYFTVIAREGGMTFMEIRPREPLAPGEYAVVGSDLAHIAAFRVAASAP